MSGLIGTRAASRFSYKRMDTDAAVYTTAAGITDRGQKAAANYYVRNLKYYNVWSKIYALYPFMGGTAATHKFNLKNPADSDAAFRMVFNGTWTHDANGVAPTPSTAYGDTFFVPANNMTTGKSGLCVYAHNFGNMTPSSTSEFGAANSTVQRLAMAISIGSTISNFYCYSISGGGLTGGTNPNGALGVFLVGARILTNSMGFWAGDMINSNLAPSPMNAVGLNGSPYSGSLPSLSVLLNGIAVGSIATAARTYGFAAIMADCDGPACNNLYLMAWHGQRMLRRIK